MLFTLIATNIGEAALFYQRLGYPAHSEKHGNGPRHFALNLEPTVLEIYPEMKSLPAGENFFIAVAVDDPEATKRDLIDHFFGRVCEPEIPTTASGIASLRDPAGVLVRLMPRLAQ